MTGGFGDLAHLAVEHWKLLAAYERLLNDVPDDKRSKAGAQLRYSRGRLEAVLESAGLQLLTFDGEPFSAELPVSPVNAEDVDGSGNPVVERTLDPAVVQDGTVVLTGKVLLRGS